MRSDYSIRVGYIVGVVFRDRCGVADAWVGDVEEVDELGLRITAMDWTTETFNGMDEWIPWRSIERITVQTPEHEPERRYWQRWQERALAREHSRGATTTGPRARVWKLEAAIRRVQADHHREGVAGVCRICAPQDGSWPCAVRMELDAVVSPLIVGHHPKPVEGNTVPLWEEEP